MTERNYVDFTPPTLGELGIMTALQRLYFSPTLDGAENIQPERPALLVGNHALFGIIDSPLFVYELYRQTGVFPRGLGDHVHFNVPIWGSQITRFGALPGTPENCRALMQQKQWILVFPGGAREVAKRKDELNQLVWKKRTGFARMAIENGFDIVPFASVGCDEIYKILVDANDILASRVGQMLLRNTRINSALRGGDLFMPLVRGIGPTLIPRPKQFRFRIGKPISTESLIGQHDDPDVLWAMREQVADSITSMIKALQEEDAQAPKSLIRRWLS